CLQGLEFPWTF
nr:immunoglobulin light chain junction region [Macaca mulatta]MOX86494.1 immunoglobulin light chain junction region [Macaca mulatta]MOX88614.1 immunoglobulin light chain junction region [Macaca mulatta]MOX88970.1 immunoglobulin light chain junction region [Macaca mulatta]MOX89300.1 immunoglobulin light chain junction region [Macaca mulatta]